MLFIHKVIGIETNKLIVYHDNISSQSPNIYYTAGKLFIKNLHNLIKDLPNLWDEDFLYYRQ